MARNDPKGNSPQLQWHDKKADLPKRMGERIVLARDVNTKGAKEFAVLPTPVAAAKFATGQVTQPAGRRQNHLYEVLEDSRDPVRLFFDLDSKGNAFTSTQVADCFRAALGGYLASVHAVQLEDLTVQMSEASRPGKTSVHAVVDLQIASMLEHKLLSIELVQFIIGHGERFLALQLSETECVLDLAVYTNFRSFRMLGMCKLGGTAVLRALPGSSSSVLDHMVGVHSQRPCAVRLQTRCQLVPPSLSGTSRPARPAATHVPHADAVKLADMLNSWPDVKEVFPGGTLQVHSAVHTEKRVRVRLAPHTVCPYAKRAHKSNNLYVNLYHTRVRADVECYDDECQRKMDLQGRTGLMNPASQQTALHDSVHDSMHAQFDNIKWHDLYDEPRMRPLPVAPLVCVRAGMGLGKTEEVKVLLNEQCPIGPDEQKTVLIITFSRKLADKCYEDFQHLDFINYQAHDGALNQARIIVCLDSLNRVVGRQFDFIIVDEACSVILHFNSPLMQETGSKSFLLESLIQQAKHVYLVDAMLDTTFMKNIVDYFAMAKGEEAVWVCNSHVRPSNRVANIVRGKAGLSKAIGTESLVFAAARKVLDLLNDGKRVVCCSSTKKFTEVLQLYISQMRPATDILVLNSKSEQKPGDSWDQFDLLVYSPSISAGVSFTAPHFDSLVGYLVNSKYTPTVDIALQQLFRVRQLAAGDMHLYVQDTASPSADSLPHTMEKVAQMLQNDIAMVTAGGHTAVSTDLSFAAQNTFKDNRVQYDQERLSYRVILGIVLTANRSAVSFTDLLVGTLREDYGIPVSMHTAHLKEAGYDADITILAEAQRPKVVPHFDTVMRLTPAQFSALANQSEHSDAEKASLKLFQDVTNVWGVSMDRVDSAFYNKLVMASSAADHYYRARRLNEACRLTLEENRAVYDRKMQKVLASDDYNLELYRTRTRKYYEMLIAGQALLIGAMGVKDRDSLQHQQVVTMLDTELDTVLARFWKEMGPKKAACVRKVFAITAGKDAKLTVGKVLRQAFDIVISHADYNKGRPAYHTLRFQLNKEALLAQCYEPTFPSRCQQL
jgi:hypothetical protein